MYYWVKPTYLYTLQLRSNTARKKRTGHSYNMEGKTESWDKTEDGQKSHTPIVLWGLDECDRRALLHTLAGHDLFRQI